MNFKKGILSLSLVAALAVSSIASTVPLTTETNTNSTTVQQIHKTIQNLSIDIEGQKLEQVKLKFMVNENNEIIVLSTDDSEIDGYLKGALNYKSIKGNDLTPVSYTHLTLPTTPYV